ncbi:MAG TPA: FAD-dependent oxidoreductase [Ktedonobacteraceae bacterium]|nr:FAD-dependent oxidoreductase [Ktedonobacteraceae bacterium]
MTQNTLFQPLTIGPREASSRIIFGSHTTNFARNNLLSEQHADYYEARAAGGAGLIVLEEHIVHPSDMPYEYALAGYLPAAPTAIAQVVAPIHAHGALAIAQLNHNGQQSVSDHSQREIWAPSAVPDVATREVPKAMELRDIQAVIEGFALATRHAVQGNADGVELQVSDRSLLRQFLSPLTNQRSDYYGGSLANRLRFVQETIEAVDAALGAERILGARLCVDELAPWAGLTPEQGVEIARLLAESGRIDYLTITLGSIFSSHMFPFHASMHIPHGYAAHLSAQVKASVNIPVFAAGRIMDTAQAERIIAEEQADGVEMIRALIADPDLPRLSQGGRVAEVRPCISCNQGCQVRSVMNAALACSVNPDVLHVGTRFIASTVNPSIMYMGVASNVQSVAPDSLHTNLNATGRDKSRPYIIIGGGPAGMEAARTAILSNSRHVMLYEREQTLGGTVTLAAKAPGRGELRLITDYLQRQLEKLGVEIRTGVEATADMLLEQRPQAVVVTTGARSDSGLLSIPGYNLPHVTDLRRILRGDPAPGQRVVIIDESGSHGVYSAAELLATRGHVVEIITEDWYGGRDLVATHDIVPWMQRVMAMGVIFTPHTSITRIEEGQVIVSDRFAAGERAIPADMVVLGVYDQPAQELYFALKGHVPRLFRAGDCIAPRRIEQAILEGRQVGLQCQSWQG